MKKLVLAFLLSLMGTEPNLNHEWVLKDGNFRNAEEELKHASNDEMFLDEEGTVRGIVTFVDENKLRQQFSNVDVILIREGAIKHQTKTIDDGTFEFKGVEANDYTIVAQYGQSSEAWLKEAENKPEWHKFEGSLAIQRIILRDEYGGNEELPVLHLSPAPWRQVNGGFIPSVESGGVITRTPVIPAAALGGFGGLLIPLPPPKNNPSSPFAP